MIADQAQTDALTIVVNTANKGTDQTAEQANKHTDEQVGRVRDDLKSVSQHSDQQIGALREDVKKLGAGLGTSISKIGKPEPPERARLEFNLWGDGRHPKGSPRTVYPVKPDKDGVFAVDFTFVNVSGVTASKVEFWVTLCDYCEYAKEPQGFVKLALRRNSWEVPELLSLS